MSSQKMMWLELVEEFMRLARSFERKEIPTAQYSEEFKRLIGLLADEIRSNPYVEDTK